MSKVCCYCLVSKASIKRPKNGDLICKECFYARFELEIHETIIQHHLFTRGEKVCLSCVLKIYFLYFGIRVIVFM